jgi:flagellar basal body P-ring formation protein FlgA
MLRTIFIGLFALNLFSPAAFAEKVSDLVIERAEAEFGPEMPVNGRFEVRLPEDMVSIADYITEFWIDRDSGRFIAIVATEDGTLKRINGVAILKVPVPVATRRILPGEIVTTGDLSIIEMPFARVNAFAITNADDLIGMQVRRVLTRGRPVQRQSVIPPIVVARGSRVTIQVKSGSLFLSTWGKALSDAYLGQEVRVVNLESNKTVVGIARSNGIVEVQ